MTDRTVIDSVSLVLSEHRNVMDHLIVQQLVNTPFPKELLYLHISMFPILYFRPLNNDYISKSKEK